MPFSVAPLLLVEEEISPEVKRALGENRLREAAQLLMREYGLSRADAAALLDMDITDIYGEELRQARCDGASQYACTLPQLRSAAFALLYDHSVLHDREA